MSTNLLTDENKKSKPIVFIFRMIRLKTKFKDVSADILYDVLHDPIYRKVSADLLYDVLLDPIYRKVSVDLLYDVLYHVQWPYF